MFFPVFWCLFSGVMMYVRKYIYVPITVWGNAKSLCMRFVCWIRWKCIEYVYTAYIYVMSQIMLVVGDLRSCGDQKRIRNRVVLSYWVVLFFVNLKNDVVKVGLWSMVVHSIVENSETCRWCTSCLSCGNNVVQCWGCGIWSAWGFYRRVLWLHFSKRSCFDVS